MAIETILIFSLAAYYVVGLGGAIYMYWPYIVDSSSSSSSSPSLPSEIELQPLHGLGPATI